MGGIVFVDDTEFVPLHLVAGHPGIAAGVDIGGVLGVLAPKGCLKTADDGAVGEQADGFVRVPLGQTEEGGRKPLRRLGEGVSALGGPLPGIGAEIDPFLRMVVDKVPQRHIFIDPHADLVETGFDTQRQPLRRHHRLGGGLGAGQFAGVGGIHMDVGEPLFQSGDLLHACGGDVAVQPWARWNRFPSASAWRMI